MLYTQGVATQGLRLRDTLSSWLSLFISLLIWYTPYASFKTNPNEEEIELAMGGYKEFIVRHPQEQASWSVSV